MSSPITLTGFNNIDFGLIIDAILEQERVPIQTLESSKSQQRAKLNAYGALETQLASIDSTRTALTSAATFDAFTASPADDSIASASAGAGATVGSHTIAVTALAQAQVLASSSSVAELDSLVADAGTLTIGGRDYTVTGDTTIAEFRDLINTDSDALARASLVDTGAGIKLVLTAKQSGTAAAFTVQNALTLAGGASPIVFTDTDGDGESGDSAADNAIAASNANVDIDGISVTRATNSIQGALAGVDLTLKSIGTTTLKVDANTSVVKEKVQGLVDAYNKFSEFMQQQFSANGTPGPLSGDFIARSASADIRAVLRGGVDTGGAFRSLAEIGIAFDRTGQLSVDEGRLDSVLTDNLEDVRKLFQIGLETTDARVRVVNPGSAAAGTYAVDVTALASSATASGSTAINDTINSDETLSFTYGALTANVLLPNNSTIGNITSLLNSGLSAAAIPIIASDASGVLVFSTTASGSAESFTVVSDTNDQGNGKSTGIGTTTLSPSGADIAGTLGGVPASGFGTLLSGALGSATAGLQVQLDTNAIGSHGTITLTGGFTASLQTALNRYLGSGGLLTNVEERADDAIGTLNQRIASMEERLVLREQELRRQFTAADQAISTLNAQRDSLTAISGRFS